MQKKKFRQHKIDHDLYRKQKSVGGALIPKFMPHTKSHMASLFSAQCSKWYEISDMEFFQITEENPNPPTNQGAYFNILSS